MADKRKPDTVLWVRHGRGRSRKIELFHADQFAPLTRFQLPDGEPAQPESLEDLFRLRVDGTWFPAGRRYLFTSKQCLNLLEKELFQ